MRILLVEDDPMIGKSLREALQDAGMSVDWARSGEDGEVALSVGAYAVVLLDIGLPGKSGIEVLRAARKTGNKTPLMLITARDELDDRVAGLDLGADDYITKPFEMRELMARLRAIMRRSGGAAISTLSNGEIELDLDTHEVRYRGKSLVLSAREFGAGTMELLDRLQPSSTLGAALGPMKAVIYRQDRTNDARDIARGIREDFIKLRGRVTVLETVVPHAKAYKEAATLRIPVHRHEKKREGTTPSAYTVMHQLAWELIPSLEGILAESYEGREAVA